MEQKWTETTDDIFAESLRETDPEVESACSDIDARLEDSPESFDPDPLQSERERWTL